MKRRTWVQPVTNIGIVRQCELANVARSTSYTPMPGDGAMSEFDLQLCTLIDEEYTCHPFYGSRRMLVFLRPQGYVVNRKRIQRLMRT